MFWLLDTSIIINLSITKILADQLAVTYFKLDVL